MLLKSHNTKKNKYQRYSSNKNKTANSICDHPSESYNELLICCVNVSRVPNVIMLSLSCSTDHRRSLTDFWGWFVWLPLVPHQHSAILSDRREHRHHYSRESNIKLLSTLLNPGGTAWLCLFQIILIVSVIILRKTPKFFVLYSIFKQQIWKLLICYLFPQNWPFQTFFETVVVFAWHH